MGVFQSWRQKWIHLVGSNACSIFRRMPSWMGVRLLLASSLLPLPTCALALLLAPSLLRLLLLLLALGCCSCAHAGTGRDVEQCARASVSRHGTAAEHMVRWLYKQLRGRGTKPNASRE